MELSCFTTERNSVARSLHGPFTLVGLGPSESLPNQNIL